MKHYLDAGRHVVRTCLAIGLMGVSVAAWAHSPWAQCRLVGAGSIQCKGGFSDGGGAQGVTLDVISYDEQILVAGKLGEDSTLTFKKPEGQFYILFDPGPGHVVDIDYTEIQS